MLKLPQGELELRLRLCTHGTYYYNNTLPKLSQGELELKLKLYNHRIKMHSNRMP
jgi:hypothetical protein